MSATSNRTIRAVAAPKPAGGDPLPTSDPVVLAALTAIHDQMAALHADVRRLLADSRRRPERANLLQVIADAFPREETFDASQVCDRSEQLDYAALATALTLACLTDPKPLGRYFGRIEGRTRDGWTLRRTGRDSRGVIYFCEHTTGRDHGPVKHGDP